MSAHASVADPKILKGGDGRKTIYHSPSSFIANAHNDLYALYTEKGGFLEKKFEPGGGRPPHRSPLNPPLPCLCIYAV